MPILFYAHVLNPNFYYCILINKADHTFHFHAYEKKKKTILISKLQKEISFVWFIFSFFFCLFLLLFLF